MIELKNISKSFKNNIIFSNTSFIFSEGKKYIITGDNGVGKSVLLKLIVGYARLDDGSILINNETLGDKFDFLPNAGVSIDAPQFSNSLSGIDNLLELAKIKKIATKHDILSLVSTFKLDGDINKKYSTYSLGMRQKMRLIQAIMEKPNYLILDEPFDGLDRDMKEMTKKIIDNYIAESSDRMLIFTSHDVSSLEFADVILKIENRQIETLI